jgi:Uma2 family endonuclease
MTDDEKKKNLLWVFDTQQYLEIYALTLQDAEKEVSVHEKDTGMEFILHPEWEIYQKEHYNE